MTEIVYTRLGRLLLELPGRLVYHEINRRRSVFGPRLEEHYTRCGRLIYRHTSDEDYGAGELERRFDAIRLDNAELVCRPCRVCLRIGAPDFFRPRRRGTTSSKLAQLALSDLVAIPELFDREDLKVALVSGGPS